VQFSDLQTVLETVGVQITRGGEREITGKCPVHERVVGHADNSPSWSINTSTGLWICFSCGARGTLSMLLSELAGDSGISAQGFLIEAGYKRLTASEETPVDNPSFVDTEQFFRFSRVSDKRCASKNLDPDLAWRYGVRWDTDQKTWIVPIISPMGRLTGWQAKKSGWVRNRPVGVEKGKTLFGIERFRSKTAVVVESPLDVVRFAAVFNKPQALATFGAHVSIDQLRLLTYTCDRVIVAMDNDEAGVASSKRLYQTLTAPRRGIRWWNYKGTTAKDIGDMADDEIERGLMTATVVPPWML
jgi:5S rRNA maturation endonuclease (ribonuclease M5)